MELKELAGRLRRRAVLMAGGPAPLAQLVMRFCARYIQVPLCDSCKVPLNWCRYRTDKPWTLKSRVLHVRPSGGTRRPDSVAHPRSSTRDMAAKPGLARTARLLLAAVAAAAVLLTSNGEGACAGGEAAAAARRQNTTDRLVQLRRLMSERGASAYIVPTEDSHLRTAFIAPADRRRHFITGYTGAIGTAIILNTEAILWTDYKNVVKAKKELDSNWKVIYPGGAALSSPVLWILQRAELLNPRVVIANSELFSAETWLTYAHSLNRYDITLADDGRIMDTLWESMPQPLRRPEHVDRDLQITDSRYNGRSWLDKVADVQRALSGHADLLVLSNLEDISWLFNLYGSDVENSNVFFAYAIVPVKGSPRLYMRDHTRRLKRISAYLQCDSDGQCPSARNPCTEVHPYQSVYDDLRILSSHSTNVSISTKSNYKMRAQVPLNVTIIDLSIVQHLRRRRNPTEVEGIKSSNLRDSGAYIEVAAMLESDLQAGRAYSELDVLQQLHVIRSKYENYKGPSFHAVIAYGSHSAETNHVPTCATNVSVGRDNLLLLDTGAHYLDGTTHVARTFHFGEPSDSQKDIYSNALRRVVDQALRRETAGRMSDGAGLSDGSSSTINDGELYFEEVEDSQYGEFGVKLSLTMLGFRLEGQNGSRALLRNSKELNYDEIETGLDQVLLIPFETKLIDSSRLKADQVRWINDYHIQCLEKVGRLLLSRNLTLAYRWLEARTGALNVTSAAPNIRQHFSIGMFHSIFLVSLLKRRRGGHEQLSIWWLREKKLPGRAAEQTLVKLQLQATTRKD